VIDIDTGIVSLDDGFIVKPKLDVATAASFPGVRRAPAVGARTQFSAGVHPSGKNTWGIGLVYENDRLAQVWLQWLDQKETDQRARHMAAEPWTRRACGNDRASAGSGDGSLRFAQRSLRFSAGHTVRRTGTAIIL
jgi:hypothetical protein